MHYTLSTDIKAIKQGGLALALNENLEIIGPNLLPKDYEIFIKTLKSQKTILTVRGVAALSHDTERAESPPHYMSTRIERRQSPKLKDEVYKEGQYGEIFLIATPHLKPFSYLILVGIGKDTMLTPMRYRKLCDKMWQAVNRTHLSEITTNLTEVPIQNYDNKRKIYQLVLSAQAQAYRFNQLKSHKPPALPLNKIHLIVRDKAIIKNGKTMIKTADAISQGISWSRDLANLPSNICTPTYLSQEARKFAKKDKRLQCKVLDEKMMAQLGMNAFLAVSKGSEEPAKMVILDYQPSTKHTKSKPIILVGKGITFDSGGISLKPGPQMDEMKFDMCGAATVLGVLRALALIDYPKRVMGVLACSENLPSGRATKPGDIVKSLSGQTIEILNTDAEGRLVLCDALTYCRRFDPEIIIDIATLTGAMVVALGNQASGIMGNNEKLRDDLVAAGNDICDRAWPFPLWEEYGEELKSPFADLANIGSRFAPALIAGCFLGKFTKDMQWAHMDIAGSAWLTGANKGATGRPVALLCNFLLNYV